MPYIPHCETRPHNAARHFMPIAWEKQRVKKSDTFEDNPYKSTGYAVIGAVFGAVVWGE